MEVWRTADLLEYALLGQGDIGNGYLYTNDIAALQAVSGIDINSDIQKAIHQYHEAMVEAQAVSG